MSSNLKAAQSDESIKFSQPNRLARLTGPGDPISRAQASHVVDRDFESWPTQTDDL